MVARSRVPRTLRTPRKLSQPRRVSKLSRRKLLLRSKHLRKLKLSQSRSPSHADGATDAETPIEAASRERRELNLVRQSVRLLPRHRPLRSKKVKPPRTEDNVDPNKPRRIQRMSRSRKSRCN
jgi:hypothetical protein